ncbi:hypothetical protein BDF21DRAFT_453820 [Thamnidium elegans]|nr:hypothetical protein BDF21DRAFT_453820 [Thamnidium elegans]
MHHILKTQLFIQPQKLKSHISLKINGVKTFISVFLPTIYESLRKLKIPPGIRNTKKYFSVLSTTIYQLWIIYWQHGNDNLVPYPLFQIELSFLRIITHIERLLHSTTLE